MQNTKLSVSRNGNQSGPCATRSKSGRGGSSVASKRPISATLGTRTESSEGSCSGHVATKNCRIHLGAKSWGGSGTAGCLYRNITQETRCEASKSGELTIPDPTLVSVYPAAAKDADGDAASGILRLCEGIGYIDAATVLQP